MSEKQSGVLTLDGVDSDDRTAIEANEIEKQPRLSFHVLEPGDANYGWGLQVEKDVFASEFGDSPELIEQEYYKYNPYSTLLVVRDEKANMPIGMWRVIHNNKDVGFKTYNDIQREDLGWKRRMDDVLLQTELELPPEKTVDLGSVAILKQYRENLEGAQAGIALYKGMIEYSKQHGIEYWVGIIDRKPFELVTQKRFGGIFHQFKSLGYEKYMGSEQSTPVYAEVARVPEIIKAHSEMFYKLIVEAEGLGEFVSFPTGYLEAS